MASVTRAAVTIVTRFAARMRGREAFICSNVSCQSSRHAKGADCTMAINTSPARHQKATSHDGASRPRKERLSTLRIAWQQTSLTAITGAGQNTESASSAKNAAVATPRLVSIYIEPFYDQAQ